jgi:hypothetical protein
MPSKDALNDLRIAMGTPFGQSGSATPAVVPGSAQDPFYQSTGVMKDVTLPDGRTVRALDVGSTRPPAATTIGMVSPSSGLTITGTERNAAKEAEARAIGMTKEYIASRGGINAQGYFNDTPISRQLTAAEYKTVTVPALAGGSGAAAADAEIVATAINGGGGECLTHCEHVAVPKLKILHDPFDSEEKPSFVLVRPLAFGDETSALVCASEKKIRVSWPVCIYAVGAAS